MLAGYEIRGGVIRQISPSPFNYTYEYVAKYNHQPVRQLSLLRIDWIKNALGRVPGSVLDFGSGTGMFLKVYHELTKAQVYAYDVVSYPLPSPIKRVADPTDKKYSLITFYDSLEHLQELDILGRIKCDFLCISVPWCHNLSDEWLRSWKHLKPNEHIWHFDRESLAATCQGFEFELISAGNPEDKIRKPADGLPNILTAIFRKTPPM
jgi:hypothetical protein